MKRYACHRLYTHPGHYLKQGTVTIDREGNVAHFGCFEEEIHSTEWIGGVIILSNKEKAELEDFQTLLSSLCDTKKVPLYAWHLSDFDFVNERITSQSILHRL